jgi:hypothetical protein
MKNRFEATELDDVVNGSATPEPMKKTIEDIGCDWKTALHAQGDAVSRREPI